MTFVFLTSSLPPGFEPATLASMDANSTHKATPPDSLKTNNLTEEHEQTLLPDVIVEVTADLGGQLGVDHGEEVLASLVGHADLGVAVLQPLDVEELLRIAALTRSAGCGGAARARTPATSAPTASATAVAPPTPPAPTPAS